MKVNQLGKYFHMDWITLFVPFWFFEILFIGEFKPKLNKQSDSMGAKVFTTHNLSNASGMLWPLRYNSGELGGSTRFSLMQIVLLAL